MSEPTSTSEPVPAAPPAEATATTAAVTEPPASKPAAIPPAETTAPPATESTTAPAPAAPAPETGAKDAPTTSNSKKPLGQLQSELAAILTTADHSEMWGVKLQTTAGDTPTEIVLTKFLRANDGDVAKAKAQLIQALQWRKKVAPLGLVDSSFDREKFGGLGYVSVYQAKDGKKEIVTWNIYGAVKDIKKTFGNVEEFIRWRAAVMELAVRHLDLPNATMPIPESGPDPYQMIQVHDYLSISFLRMDPTIRAASKEVISTFAMAYPELLKEKFFINVPVIMGWVFAAMKVFLSKETIRKFHPMSYGNGLAGELPEVGEKLPKVYGGKGKDLEEEGEQVKWAAAEKAD